MNCHDLLLKHVLVTKSVCIVYDTCLMTISHYAFIRFKWNHSSYFKIPKNVHGAWIVAAAFLKMGRKIAAAAFVTTGMMVVDACVMLYRMVVAAALVTMGRMVAVAAFVML